MAGGSLMVLVLLAAVGSGVIGGVFFAFSTFVMRALIRLPTAQGMAAMQHINVTVINLLFMTAFLGTVALCVVLAIIAGLRWGTAGSGWLLVGSLLYLVGTFGVTMAFNVPLNNALAAANADDPGAAGLWTDYVTRWTRWNHVRTIAALAALVAFILAHYSVVAG